VTAATRTNWTIDYTGSYDAWGNTTSQQRGSTTKSTAYDAQDHLLHWSSTTNNQQEWYLYDASGERVLRRSFDGTNTTLTVYAFGIEEHQYAYSGSGSTATNTGNTYYYTLAGRLLGTWDGTSPTTTFLLTDSLGSVVSSFNNPASGAVMQGNQLYGPYGNQRLKQGSLSTNKGFTGQYNDGLTGLDYDHARYYDPTIGLFLSADPMGGLDAYGYVGGNPESETDPSGLYRVAAIGPWGGSSASMSAPVVSSGGAGSLPYPFQPWTPPPVPAPAGGLVSHYTPPLPAPAAGVFHHPTSSAPAPIKITVVRRPGSGVPGSQDSCGGTGNEIFCMNWGVNYAFYGPGGATYSLPGTYCPGCADIGGGNDPTENGRDEEPNDTVGTSDVEESADQSCGGGLSFTATTQVATAHGEQAIGTLKPGQKVLAYNPKTHSMELQPILHVWINHDNDLVDLTITHAVHTQHGKAVKASNEVIHTNKKHPFLTVEKGFLPVGKIKLGMHVVEANG
jgi:RHS repeat-associated protein